MSIQIFKNPRGLGPSPAKAKALDIDFSTFEEAEMYFTEKILSVEAPYKYVTFILKDLPMASKVREYLFLEDDDTIAFSYRIVESK